jgi:3-hydroxyacyl-CoA dehydrogenase
MATHQIRKVAVIGAGVMGRGIAAHLASAHIQVYLLDIVPPNPGPNDDTSSPEFRNRFAAGALVRIAKDKPSVIQSNKDLDYITPGNVEDHLNLLGEVDWIVEAVPESMKIKQATFDKIEAHARPDTIIASNTSGLSIKGMLEGRSESFRKRFIVTHFFNPVRYMKLLEIVPGEDTTQDVIDTVVKFGSETLGKGIVFGKDTTNFIANRIGVHGMMTVIHQMAKHGLTVEEVDAIFAKPMGRPKSAVFRTADVVGLDTFVHVSQNCYDTLADDEERSVFQIPDYVQKMVAGGMLGSKTGKGFYQKVGKDILVLDLNTLEYRAQVKPEFASLATAKGAPGARIKKVVVEGDDKAAAFAREVTLRSLAYSARRLGEISDDIVNIDRGMRWGFNWDLGPFETWDAIGLGWGAAQMKEQGIAVPAWIDAMIAAGHTSFYKTENTDTLYYDPTSASYKTIERGPREMKVEYLKLGNKKVFGNDGASLYDAGDGIAVLEFHTKVNSVDIDMIDMIHRAVDEVEQNWEGLVVANDSDNFSMGANLFMVFVAIQNGAWDQIETLIKRFQDANQRMRFSSKPVVTAPSGMTLGGGAEMTMGGNAIQAAAELYMGLVEMGVGLIPGGGGNLQLMRNVFGPHSDSADFNPLPFIQKIFLTVGMAKVAVSAEDAREIGFLTANDGISFNRDHQLYDAKQRALGMARAGFTPPRPMKFRLPGRDGIATIDMLLDSMVQNNQISAYDRHIGQKLATVLCGGKFTSTGLLVTEQQLLDLEREAFLSLCGEAKTQERIQGMLMNNKPVRN